jgi:hypothetical protein
MNDCHFVYRYGQLERPSVVGNDEYEAILKGWIKPRTAAWMLAVQVGGWVGASSLVG